MQRLAMVDIQKPVSYTHLKYLAESYFKLGENLKAAEQYEQIRKLESNEEELEEIYEKLQLIYEEAQEYEKVWEISREAVEMCIRDRDPREHGYDL